MSASEIVLPYNPDNIDRGEFIAMNDLTLTFSPLYMAFKNNCVSKVAAMKFEINNHLKLEPMREIIRDLIEGNNIRDIKNGWLPESETSYEMRYLTIIFTFPLLFQIMVTDGHVWFSLHPYSDRIKEIFEVQGYISTIVDAFGE